MPQGPTEPCGDLFRGRVRVRRSEPHRQADCDQHDEIHRQCHDPTLRSWTSAGSHRSVGNQGGTDCADANARLYGRGEGGFDEVPADLLHSGW